MSLQITALTGPMALASVLHLSLAAMVWQERPKTGVVWFALDLFSIGLWAAGQLLVVSATTLEVALLGYTVTLAGLVLIVPTWLVFAVRYTGHPERFTGWRLLLLFVEPVVVLALGLTNGAHGLVFANPAFHPAAGANALSVGFGPVFWAHAVYGVVLLSVGNRLMYRKVVGSRNAYRNRTALILTGSVLMIVAFGLSTVGLSPLPHHTLAPFVNLATIVVGLAVVLGYVSMSKLPIGRVLGVFAGRSKSLAPLARTATIEELNTGFVVIDHENRVVDVNPIGRLILGRSNGRVIGKHIGDLLPAEIFVDGRPPFLDPAETGQFEGVWVETADGERRCFDADITELTDGGQSVGRVGLIHDVTSRERRKRQLEERTQELERQNEQLEEFAGIVSHDLRNPLNVAAGHLSMLDLGGSDAEAVATARNALDRMEEIIDDVLALARSGQTVDDTEAVSLAATVREAWETVDTRSASLTVETDATVEADPSRLHRLFENLFRNAVEHGGDDVAVTVGSLENGVYVTDDGPGIPESERESIFRQGYSTAEEGTGFGLAIVRTIAQAHGWTVDVTESEEGGARFDLQWERPLPAGPSGR